MRTRIEFDSLGAVEVPEDAYYGVQTKRAMENFPVSGLRAPDVFNLSYVYIKKAAALANMETCQLDKVRGKVIIKACDELLKGGLRGHLVIDIFQAGAGTSFNMNVNEVIANRSLELMGKPRGDYKSLSPNDHVNLGQSTNDTFPTALHVSILLSLPALLREIQLLSNSFASLGRRHKKAIKSGRTHLQDALPVTIGHEFSAYAVAIRRCSDQIKARGRLLCQVALGGTATGSGAGAHPHYQELALKELNRMTGLKLLPAEDLFDALQSRGTPTAFSGALRDLAVELIRIANDLRLLSSGPTTGLSEIQLPAVQPGSSIMPGKVNPVMAECMDMIGFQIIGNDLTVSLASQAGQLELNVMTPVIMWNILQSMELLTNYLPVFRRRCVDGITVDEKRCREYLERNPSLAVFLVPYIGYLKAAEVAKEALAQGKSIKALALEKGLIAPEDAEWLFGPDALLGKGPLTKK